MAGKLLANSHEARVYAHGNRVRKEIRETWLWKKPVLNPLQVFWAHKIAEALFPGRVVQYSLAKRKVLEGKKKISGAVLVSRPVETTGIHRDYVRWFYKKMRDPLSLDFMTEMTFAPEEVRRHYDRVQDSWKLRKAADEMWEAGVLVNEHPANVDFINGRPFFFEIHKIDGRLIQQTIRGHPKGERIRRYYERYKEAARKGSVYLRPERRA